MRTATDALRSLKKYVAQVLSPNPSLAAVEHASTVWTTRGQVHGATDVDAATFAWLLSQDRFPPVIRGSAELPLSYYQATVLVADPAAAAALAGVSLAGPTVAGWALNLQPVWEVRLWFDRDEIPTDRPYARVEAVGSSGFIGPALWTQSSVPFAVECYPVKPATADEAVLAAGEVEAVLTRAFRGAGFGLGRPLRVPLWNWDGVPLDQTSDERNASDFMRVNDFSTRQLPDPQDPRARAVVVDLRLAWDRATDQSELLDREGRPVRGTRLVEQVDVEWTTS